MVATGSPFDPVTYKGKTYTISQCNNAFIFPGLTLGMVASKARKMNIDMVKAAYLTLANQCKVLKLEVGCVLPSLDDIKEVNFKIAIEVCKAAIESGVSCAEPGTDVVELVKANQWKPSLP